MLRRFTVFFLFVSATFFPSLAFCQGGGVGGSSAIITVDSSGQGTTGLPYSAQLITTQVQTLADGTQITHVSKQVQARDSQGRMRTEIYFPEGLATDQNANQPTFIMIHDPVGRQFIHLDPRQKTARVSTFPALAERLGPQANPAQTAPPSVQFSRGIANGTVGSSVLSAQSTSPAQSIPQATGTRTERQHTVEKLPGQTIDGVYAEGRRITRVVPANTEGNNRGITVVTESWTSPELKILVLSKTTDPRSGETTTEIKDLSRDEPAPELFQIPEDYKIENHQ